ncbi:hypothetical protein LFX27_16715 [Leptospira mtsangambouensis]|nr:hypothetical protein [Leptospira mtsangambouensis]MCG6142246.1 hypothetical protein [Leptospira mtsangambouensis]
MFVSNFYAVLNARIAGLDSQCASYSTNIMIGEVNDIGNLHFEGHRIFLSSALADEEVGLEEISDRHCRLYFATAILGILDLYTSKVLKYQRLLYRID